MAKKFVRGLVYTTGITTAKASNFLKLMYEFWGYCVWGGASLTSPGTGAFASTTPIGGGIPGNFTGTSTTITSGSNGQTLPQGTINVVSTTGFPTSGTLWLMSSDGNQLITYTGTTGTTFTGCTGGTGTMSTGGIVNSSSLMAIGSDGYTNATTIFRQDGYTDFYSPTGLFNGNMVGKALVTWKANSGSSEDSIYPIIAYKSPTNIVINVNVGGTPSGAADGYRPTVTTRNSINFRVIDVAAASSTTGVADGNYIVFQFDPTGINAGQATPQVQWIIRNSNLRMNANFSVGGTWTGSAFTDGSGELTNNTGTSQDWFAGVNSTAQFSCLMIGDKDFFIVQGKEAGNGSGTGFHMHMEIPDRLYTQAQDLNPFIISPNGYISGATSPFISSTVGYGHGGGFYMRCSDGTARRYRTSVKALIGDGNSNLMGLQIQNIPGTSLTDFRPAMNVYNGTMINSHGYLSLPQVSGQYSLARVRLRNVRFTNNFMAAFTRFGGANGDWLLVSQGIAIPWDKTVLPLTMFPFTS